MCQAKLTEDEATDEIKLVRETVLAASREITAKGHKIDDTDEVGLLTVKGEVSAVLGRNAGCDHIAVELEGVFSKLSGSPTKVIIPGDVERDSDGVIDHLRHLGGDTISPANAASGELSETHTADALDANLEVEGFLRNRKCGAGKDLVARLNVLRIGRIELHIPEGVPGLTVPVPEHLERCRIAGVEEGDTNVIKTRNYLHCLLQVTCDFIVGLMNVQVKVL
jgi:hypothetical protein